MSKMETEQKEKPTEGGDSPDSERSRVVGIAHSDTEVWIEESEDPEMSIRKVDEEEEPADPEMEDDYDEVEEEEDEGIWVPPPPTDEEKEKIALKAEEDRIAEASYSEFLIQNYGTDDREAIACIVERKQAAYAAKFPPKLRYYDDDYEEPMLDDKEVERVNNILDHIDLHTKPFSGIPRTRDLLPDINLFLLKPWVDADCTPRNKNGTARTLDMYYKRFFPCVQSACSMIHPYLWNRVPEVDTEYLSIYSKLCGLVKQDEKSWISLVNSTPENRIEYDIKALEMAKELNLKRLKECDITECLEDVFKEGDITAELKLKLEYDLFLLETVFCEGLLRENFKPREHTSVFEHIVFFNAASQQLKFDLWWEEVRTLKFSKDQCKIDLNAHHERKLSEYCGTRIRYVKFKRTCAEKFGIIFEETC